MTAELVALGTFAAGAAGGALLMHWRRSQSGTPDAVEPEVEHPRTSDERFDALVRALPLGVIMLDRRLRVRFANRAAGAIFGFERSLARGRHLITAAPHIELEARAQAALRGERFSTPLIISGKNVNRSYAVNVYPLVRSDDDDEQQNSEVTGILVLAEDQTDLLALERARQDFLTNVSHELRTPLSSIKLMLETVEHADEEARGIFLPQVLVQVDRLIALVQSLLEQARTQSGKMELDIREIDLEEIARPIVQSFEPQAAAKNVDLELHCERPAIIEADEQRLSQIFVNLIDNALRYTPEGGSVTVTIDVQGAYAIVRVRDTGIGIPYKDIPYVFERFYVVDRSRARGFSGAGLGLSIVKEIVDAHHGEVEVDSRLGRGTTFTVKVPAVSVAT